MYAIVPTSTIDLSLASGEEIPIEYRSRNEVVYVDGSAVAPEESEVFNPAFDVTPHQYITAIVTEKGICYPPFTESLKRVLEKAWCVYSIPTAGLEMDDYFVEVTHSTAPSGSETLNHSSLVWKT